MSADDARLAAALEPWWRCVHPPEPMTVTMEVGRCVACELERLEAAVALRYQGITVNSGDPR